MSNINVNYDVLNQKGSPAWYSDLFVNLPTPGYVGRMFISTDTFSFYRDNGASWDLVGGPGTGTITGTGTSGQVSFFNGTNSITSNAAFTFTPTSQLLVNNSVTAASLIARGTNITPTLVAAANNDVLVGLEIASTFTNGAFTNVRNTVLRLTNTAGSIDLSPFSNSNVGSINELSLNFGNTILSGAAQLSTNRLRTGSAFNNRVILATPNIAASNAAYLFAIDGFQYNVGMLYDRDNGWVALLNGTGTNNTSYTPRLYVHTNGNVGINTGGTDVGYKLDVNGTVRLGALTGTSATFSGRVNINGAIDNSLFSLNSGGTLYTVGFSPTATANSTNTLSLTTAQTTWIYTGTGTASWTLPNPSGTNQIFYIKNAGTGIITLNAFAGTNIINNAAASVSSITIAIGATVLIQQDGNVKSYQLQ